MVGHIGNGFGRVLLPELSVDINKDILHRGTGKEAALIRNIIGKGIFHRNELTDFRLRRVGQSDLFRLAVFFQYPALIEGRALKGAASCFGRIIIGEERNQRNQYG